MALPLNAKTPFASCQSLPWMSTAIQLGKQSWHPHIRVKVRTVPRV